MNNKKLKNKLYHIIFEAETPSGKLFDVLLLITIVLSVICVALESVTLINVKYGTILKVLSGYLLYYLQLNIF